mmetsp:Transcript_51910/g.107315  ORF Transcript_51910/g.107315 Transcript_51910/m.107315 type:complete len:89 (-) Transcript_51910:178-444(-)
MQRAKRTWRSAKSGSSWQIKPKIIRAMQPQGLHHAPLILVQQILWCCWNISTPRKKFHEVREAMFFTCLFHHFQRTCAPWHKARAKFD